MLEYSPSMQLVTIVADRILLYHEGRRQRFTCIHALSKNGKSGKGHLKGREKSFLTKAVLYHD